MSIAIHPEYNSVTTANDLALILLKTPITKNSYAHEVCLPDGNETYEGQDVWVTGWGKTYGGLT